MSQTGERIGSVWPPLALAALSVALLITWALLHHQVPQWIATLLLVGSPIATSVGAWLALHADGERR